MQDGTKFTEGELINVSIRGARVESLDDVGIAVLSLPNHAWRPTVNTRATGVQIERVAPKEWPPQAGDVWKGREDTTWFVRYIEAEPYMVSTTVPNGSPDYVLGEFGPMRLVYREGWTPAAPVESGKPEPVDERAEMVAGLRELADLLEGSDLSFRPYLNWLVDSPEQWAEWVAALDVRTSEHPHEGTIQHWARAALRGLRLQVTWIENLPAEPLAEPSIESDDFDATCGSVPVLTDPFTSTRFPTGPESAFTEPGDAERTAQVEGDAAEGASYRAEEAAELAGDVECTLWHPEPCAFPGSESAHAIAEVGGAVDGPDAGRWWCRVHGAEQGQHEASDGVPCAASWVPNADLPHRVPAAAEGATLTVEPGDGRPARLACLNLLDAERPCVNEPVDGDQFCEECIDNGRAAQAREDAVSDALARLERGETVLTQGEVAP